MKGRAWFLRGIGAALILLYLFVMPGYIGQQRQEHTLKRQQETGETFSGIINLWHIVGFKPYQGSLGTWLSDRAASFEKDHFGVFINVTAMTQEEYQARIQRGERADIYSFPLGWGYPELFQPLPEMEAAASLLPELAHTGQAEGAAYGLPYAMSGYFFLVNSGLEQERGLSFRQDNWLEILKTAPEGLEYTYEGEESSMLAGEMLPAALLGLEVKMGSYDGFKNQAAVAALSDARAVGDLERQQQAGKGFVFRAWALGDYTDLVQYMGISRQAEAGKLPYIQAFLELLIEPENQAKLEELGLLPAIPLEKEPGVKTGTLAEMEEALASPQVPNAFLYQRYKETLQSLAQQALAGEGDARKDLESRMKELLEQGGQIQ